MLSSIVSFAFVLKMASNSSKTVAYNARTAPFELREQVVLVVTQIRLDGDRAGSGFGHRAFVVRRIAGPVSHAHDIAGVANDTTSAPNGR